MNKNSSWETTVKPVVVLSVIALIVSLLLAMVNSFTAPIIEDNQKAATLAAYVDVMPTVSSASDLEEVTDYTTENITGAVKATDGSLAYGMAGYAMFAMGRADFGDLTIREFTSDEEE